MGDITSRTGNRARRGVVMVMTLGCLLLLSLLGVTFIHMSSMERRVAVNFIDDVRAKMVAQSGMEDAVSRIQTGFADRQGPHAMLRAMRYWGDGVAEDSTAPSTRAVPLDTALNPSFAIEDEAIQNPNDAVVTPWAVQIDGRARGISGSMETGTYGGRSDVYSLRVVDTSSCINVNEGLGHPYGTANLIRILNRLGSLPGVNVADLGTRLVGNRAPGGYNSRAELQGVLGADYDQVADYLTCHGWRDPAVANPVPLSAQAAGAYLPSLMDTRPTAGGAPMGRFGRNRRYDGMMNLNALMFFGAGAGCSTSLAATSVYGLDELNPQYVEVTSRAPVNVNTAAREVLVALLMDIEGFYLAEQRRTIKAGANQGAHYALYIRSAFHRYDVEADLNVQPEMYHTAGELGVLFRTWPVDLIMAGSIASKIIERRQIRPFTSWQDFGAFIDGMVGTVIRDPRPATTFAVYPGVTSTMFDQRASQAIADALKANFDPNLHLNELNPDLAVHLSVDKTDLVRNSTEFCFLPTGVFDVESLGRVLMPGDGGDALTAANNRIAAEKRVSAVVRVFEPYREGSQKQFYAGSLSERTSVESTSGNTGLTIGPEPDNGAAPAEADYEGYLTLSTYGGSLPGTETKPKSTTERTDPNGSSDAEALGSTIHAHFDLDFDLHRAAGVRNALTATSGTLNWADRGEEAQPWQSPYCTAYAPARYRLARTYRWNGSTLAAASIAPPDLRIDGAYSERSSAPAFEALNHIDSRYGTVAYWVKLGFESEFGGKPRLFFNVDQGGVGALTSSRITSHWWVSGFSTASEANPGTFYGPVTPLAGSMAFGATFIWSPLGGTPRAFVPAAISPPMTHLDHTHPTAKRDQIAPPHQWVHVVASWNLNVDDPAVIGIGDAVKPSVKFYLNGKAINQSMSHAVGGSTYPPVDNFRHLDLGNPRSPVPIRLGAGPHVTSAVLRNLNTHSSAEQARNYPADSTIDEFYLWGNADDATRQKALSLYALGRYYRENDGTFTSGAINPASWWGGTRFAPPASTASAPTPVATASVAATGARPRILGVTWTVRGDAADGVPNPVGEARLGSYRYAIHDYAPVAGGTDPAVLDPRVTVQLSVDDGATWGVPMSASGWSAVSQTLEPGSIVRYRVRFDTGADPLNAVLLQTPVFDDLTLYVERQEILLLSIA